MRRGQRAAMAMSRSRHRETLPVAPRGSSVTRQNSVGTLGRGSSASHAARNSSARSGQAGSDEAGSDEAGSAEVRAAEAGSR